MATSILTRRDVDPLRGKHLQMLRAKNRAEMRRASAVQNVYERLEVFGVTVLLDSVRLSGLQRVDQLPTSAEIRHHAEQIVNAVAALLREPVQ